VRSFLTGVATYRTLLAVLVLPVFLGSLIVWSLADRAEKVEQVPAAVVNLDEPVLEKGQPPIAGGRMLAAGLTQPEDDAPRGLGWELTSAADARRGLAEGDYYAVLTIPKTFSRQLAGSLQGKDPRRAEITVRSNERSSALVAEISDQVGQVAANRLGEEITTHYLGGLYEQTGKLGGQLGEASDGAERLAQGTSELSSGAMELADGLSRLGAGAERLADGQAKLGRGADRLAAGQEELAEGAERLAGGLGTLSRRTDPLPRQTDRLADGAAQLRDGVVPYTKLLRGWKDACADPLIAARAGELCAGTIRAVGVDDSNAEKLAQGSRQLASGTRELADGMVPLESGIDRLAGGARELSDGADELTGGARELSGGADRLTGGARKLSGGAREAADGAEQLASGGQRLDDGSRELASGLAQGSEAIPTYDKGESRRLADVIAAPVSAQSERLGQASDGRSQLVPGAVAVALWLGAFITYLVRPALPGWLLARPRSAGSVAFAGLRPGLLIAAGQVVLLYAGLLLLGVGPGSPVTAFGLMLLAAASFMAINQALVATLGRRRGWVVSIALAGLQIVSLGGVIPIATAPGPMRLLHDVLPMPQAAEGLVATVLDGPASLAAAVLVLLLWGGASFAVSTSAARRAQRVDVRDLTREQEPQPA
jgi:putative membrane protein